jgi:cytidyltransferase-like protein
LKRILVAGSFDDFSSSHVRLLQEAHRLGAVHVLIWSDRVVEAVTGGAPAFPEAERSYLVGTDRYVSSVSVSDDFDTDCEGSCLPLPALIEAVGPEVWLDAGENPGAAELCTRRSLTYRTFDPGQRSTFPEHDYTAGSTAAGPARGGAAVGSPLPKVVATGCFDWFHSGHVRFFEEASAFGDLYVVVGSDRNVRMLKGEKHPLFSQGERRYLVGSVRYVREALISTGSGWLDAEPEIETLNPDVYVVNADGDRPEKRAYCRTHGIEYRVLARTPKQGLAPRSSTVLRGF